MTSTHGSHTNQANGTYATDNGVTVSPDPAVASHKVSWGSTLRTTAFNNEDIASERNLNVLVNAINDIRRSMGASPIARSSVTNASQLQSAVSALASLSITRHQWGTAQLTGHGNQGGGHNSHVNSGPVSNNSSGSLSLNSITSTVTTYNGTSHPITATWPQKYARASVTLSPGSITYSSTPQTLLNNLNGKMLLSSYLPSFGSYVATIKNHASHNSHSSCKEEVKDDIKNLKLEALDLIKKINLVAFNYKENSGEDPTIRHYGFIAENTDEAFSTHYHDRMDYTNCIGLLLKAVQELSDKIEALENK